MATKKTTGKQTGKKQTATKKQPAKTKPEKEKKPKRDFIAENSKKIMLVYFALFLLFGIVSFVSGQNTWVSIRSAVFSFFGISLFLFDVILLVQGIILAINKPKRKFIFSVIGAVLLTIAFASIIQCFALDDGYITAKNFDGIFSDAVADGGSIAVDGIVFTGGMVGAFFGGHMALMVGKPLAIILNLLLLIFAFFWTFNVSFVNLGDFISARISGSAEEISEKRQQSKQRKQDIKAATAEDKERHKAELEEQRRKEKLDREEYRRQRELQIREARRLERERQRKEKLAKKEEELRKKEQETDWIDDIFSNDSQGRHQEYHYGDGDFYDYGNASRIVSGGTPAEPVPQTDRPPRSSRRKMPGGSYLDMKSGKADETKTEPQKTGIHSDVVIDDDSEHEDEYTDVYPDFVPVAPIVPDITPEPTEPPEVTEVPHESIDIGEIIAEADESHRRAELANREQVHSFEEVAEEAVYQKPSVDFLAEPEFDSDIYAADEMQKTGAKLIETLKSFNVDTIMLGACRGPSVTRYELQPASGVRINKITNLIDDIALNLAASSVRIEAPIPGKSAVGIEVPNLNRATVYLKEIIASKEFQSAKSKLTVALGKDIAGQVQCADLSRMPHLLVAGTTGSGKSVTMNCMIISILYNATPDEVKLLLIDPKQVEFSVYDGIPHLYVPVISDAKKASGALTWAVSEMERRYNLFNQCKVRDLSGYNKYVDAHPEKEELRHIEQTVIFIDELADLMMVSPKEVEDAICRLAQKARAAGMHLVVATQRPSVDVVTGLIKANVPSRLALSVSSQVDSRTIIDVAGAEKLLGNGDMLFNPQGVSKPLRIQGAFVSDGEIETIVEFLKSQSDPDYNSEINTNIEEYAQQIGVKKGSSSDVGEVETDKTFDEILLYACEQGEISISDIQTYFKKGYNYSKRVFEIMRAKGYLGVQPAPTKKTPVLLTVSQYWELKANEDTGSSDDKPTAPLPPSESTSFDEEIETEFDIFSD